MADPIVDLNGAAGGINNSVTFNEGTEASPVDQGNGSGAGVLIADGGAAITDNDMDDIVSFTVLLTNPLGDVGEQLLFDGAAVGVNVINVSPNEIRI